MAKKLLSASEIAMQIIRLQNTGKIPALEVVVKDGFAVPQAKNLKVLAEAQKRAANDSVANRAYYLVRSFAICKLLAYKFLREKIYGDAFTDLHEHVQAEYTFIQHSERLLSAKMDNDQDLVGMSRIIMARRQCMYRVMCDCKAIMGTYPNYIIRAARRETNMLLAKQDDTSLDYTLNLMVCARVLREAGAENCTNLKRDYNLWAASARLGTWDDRVNAQ